MASSRKEYWVEHSSELPHKETGYWVDSEDYDYEYTDSYELYDSVMDDYYSSYDSSDVYDWADDNYTISDLLDMMNDNRDYSDVENEFWDHIREGLPCAYDGEDYEVGNRKFIWVWYPLDPEVGEQSSQTPAPEGGGATE